MATDYYITQGSSADDLNGGGPSLGANDGPVYSTADATVAVGTETVITDNSGSNWAGYSVGDRVNWDTAGVKENRRVVSVTGAAMTVESACTVGANKAARVGGAWASFGHAVGLLTTSHVNAAGDWIYLNVKRHSGTAYTGEYNIVPANAGTTLLPFTVEGYNTSARDIDWMTSTDRAMLEYTAAQTSTRLWYQNVAHWRMFNIGLYITGTNNDGWVSGPNGDYCQIYNMRIKATGTGLFPSYNANYCLFARLLVEDCGSWGVGGGRAGEESKFIGCVIRNNANGMYMPTRGVVKGCAIYGNTGVGLSAHVGLFAGVVINNFIADNGGDGVDLGTEADLEQLILLNNIIAHNGGWGIDSDLAAGTYRFGWQDYNVFYNNTSGTIDTAHIADESQHNTTGTEPFTETTAATRKSTGDYSLTAGVKQIGYPGEIAHDSGDTAANFTGYADPGALRHEDPAGGGGGLLVHPGMGGGMRG